MSRTRNLFYFLFLEESTENLKNVNFDSKTRIRRSAPSKSDLNDSRNLSKFFVMNRSTFQRSFNHRSSLVNAKLQSVKFTINWSMLFAGFGLVSSYEYPMAVSHQSTWPKPCFSPTAFRSFDRKTSDASTSTRLCGSGWNGSSSASHEYAECNGRSRAKLAKTWHIFASSHVLWLVWTLLPSPSSYSRSWQSTRVFIELGLYSNCIHWFHCSSIAMAIW